MRIAYLTHDEVNAAAARKFAAQLGLALNVLDIRQTDPSADMLVCDLDHLPAEVKADLLANARAGIDLTRVGMHSYGFLAGEKRLLRAAGATVSCRLTVRHFLPYCPNSRPSLALQACVDHKPEAQAKGSMTQLLPKSVGAPSRNRRGFSNGQRVEPIL